MEKTAWRMCGKIIVSKGAEEGGASSVILCDVCPCKRYIIAVRCDLTWEGPPECTCTPVSMFQNRVSILEVQQDANGVVMIRQENECGRLGETIKDDAYGHVYHAIDSNDENPTIYCSHTAAAKAMANVEIPPDMEYDTSYPAYYTYWGLRGIEACPCPCKYAKVLACGVLEDGSSENVPYDLLNWSKQVYVVRVSEWNNSIWLENPYYGSYKEAPTETGVVRKWLQDCTSYPAAEVYGSDYLYNNRLSSEYKRQSIKVVQLSEAFDTYDQASSWGSEWNHHQWARLLCATCDCTCLGNGLTCGPAGYNVSVSYEATVTITNSDNTDYSSETVTTYKGSTKEASQKYIHPEPGDCYGPGGTVSVECQRTLDDGSANFTVDVERTSTYTSSTSGTNTSTDEWVESPRWLSVSFGSTDCSSSWNPATTGDLPGIGGSSNWPEGKNPWYQQSGADYNYRDYWALPTYDKDQPWPHGTWTMNYNETETITTDYGNGNSWTYTSSIQATVTIEISAYFDDTYTESPPASAVGCGAGADTASTTVAPLLISANYRKFYNQLSEDLK